MIASAPSASTGVARRLAEIDASLASSPWRSLAPGRTWARSLVEVAELVLGGRDDAVARALAESLATIATAMQRAFPENIFGDLELLAASLWRGALATDDPVACLRIQGERVAALQELFGRGTPIRFRYVHDFVYGFDWAKWVAKDPPTRAGVGAFDAPFLAFMDHRGHELLELIAAGRDGKYPPLPDGRPRNPFGFSREPEAEIRLHRTLAAEGLLPVEAWRVDARPRWDRPYAALRREVAERLGLAQPAAGDPG
ncbi:MAG: ferrochelatase [Myxococcales bacterium]|nr:ferrochelatase [Myxococcales bacterium]MCB9717093.1 ferrochelatase [Myxococcales bacterium]